MDERRDEDARVAAATPSLVQVAKAEDLPPGAVMPVVVEGSELALVNTGGNLVAIGDLCLRCGASLSSGALAAAQLTCPKCGWRYDVIQGCVVGLPALRVERREVRVADGELFVPVLVRIPPVPTC
jgi:nitrite reductase/ring-hydroxylating ferredoxin subunit